MSLRTLLIWCIIAGLLGGAAVVLRDRGVQAAQNQQPEWVGLQFDPASVTEMRIERPSSSVQIGRAGESVDEWTGSWDRGGETFEWGVGATRVRGALRALATARVRLSDARLVEDESGRVLITARDGSTTSLLLAEERSGGRAPVRVEQRDASGAIERVLDGWLESSVADALTPDIALSWRDEKLMAMAASSVESIRISAPPYTTTLERLNGRWWITDPVRVHADREKSEQLVRSALALKAAGFVEQDVDDATSGMDSPLAQIEVKGANDAYSLSIGGKQADIGGDLLWGRFERETTSTMIYLTMESFTRLTAVPDAYVSSIAASFGSTEARGMVVRGRDGSPRLLASRQDGDWWIGDTRADTLTRDAIDRLVGLLTSSNADAVRLLQPDAEFPKLIAGVDINDAQGGSLGSYEVALQSSDSGMRLLVMQTLSDGQRVVWSYSGDDAQATGTWLTIAATRAGSAG